MRKSRARITATTPFRLIQLSLCLLLLASLSCKKDGNGAASTGTGSINTGTVVSTLAGGDVSASLALIGPGAFIDGMDTAARFSWPTGIVIDSQANIYVADEYNYAIRRISAGMVSTFGPKDVFDGPDGIVMDTKGNFYVLDNVSNRVWIMPATGPVTIFVGAGAAGNTNGTGFAASEFDAPTGIAIDAQGNLYLSETNDIRKITPGLTATTIAGTGSPYAVGDYVDGPDSLARFNNPTGLALDKQGNIYVADAGNHRIRKITPDGMVSTLAGSGQAGFTDGQGVAAQFDKLNGITLDAQGNIYVSDFSCIRKITPNGAVTTIAGTHTLGFADGPAATAQFKEPTDLAFDAEGNLYVSDSGNERIRKITF